jgi:hypothetical protein
MHHKRLDIEMLRQIKIAKDTAVNSRAAAVSSLKAVLVTASLGAA